MGNLSGESREQNRKDKVTRFASVTYASQLGLLVNTLGSHLKFYGPRKCRCHGKVCRSLTSDPQLVYSMKTCSCALCVLWYSSFIP